MAVPSQIWSETSPAGSDNVSAGDDRIREMKTQIREVIAVDHEFTSTQTADTGGQHKKVTLQERADLGTGAEGVPILGAQTVSGKAELVFTTEGDADIQFTKGDYPYYSAPENVAGMAGIMNLIYPVGYIVTLGVSTNPGTLFGIGTWTAIAGKVIVGIDSTQTEFDTLNETGGAKTHTLTTAQIPAHTHTVNNKWEYAPGGYGSNSPNNAAGSNTGSTGGGEAHNNLQPYIVKYVWERTA